MSDYSDESDDSFMDDDELYFKQDKVFSLEELCLRSIVNSFSRYNDVFTNSTNALFHRNLQFLQRVYTHQLLQMFISISPTHGLPKEYLKFFVNDYLREFKLQYFSPDGYPELIELVKDVGHSFCSLDFLYLDPDFPSNAVNDIILHSPNIENLVLPSNAHDEMVKDLPNTCKKLRVLEVEDCIHFSSDFVMSILKSIHCLEKLKYVQLPQIIYSAHESDFKNHSLKNVNKYNLQTLDFQLLTDYEIFFVDQENLDDILTVCAELCPNVKNLCVKVSLQKHVEAISLFDNLLSLHIICDKGANVDLNSFLKQKGQQLTELYVETFELCISTLMQLCPKLKSLSLKNVVPKIVSNNASPLPELEDLAVICTLTDVNNCHILKHLMACSPKLKKAHFCCFDFEDSAMQAVLTKSCSNHTLKDIKLENCSNITKGLLKSVLSTCSSEAILSLRCCKPITSKELSSIRQINNTVEISYMSDRVMPFLPGDPDFSDGWTDDDGDDFYDGYGYPYDIDDYYGFEGYEGYYYDSDDS